MATWTTALEASVKVDEELEGTLMTALVAAFADPKPGLVLASGRLAIRLEVEADLESEAARLATERFARALEEATYDLLPLQRPRFRLSRVGADSWLNPAGPSSFSRSLPR